MKKILGVLLLPVLCIVLLAQPQPDRWRGMVINESSPEDAITAFGKPSDDKTDRFFVSGIDSKWITPKQKEKIFRRLSFKKLDGIKQCQLTFLENKLVAILLIPDKEIQAAALGNIYGVEFVPRISGMQQALNPRDYERHEGRVYPKNYPSVYDLVAVTPKTFITAGIGNTGFGKVLKESMGAGDAGSSFPGKAYAIQIISRTLENRDGADVLK